MKTMRYDAVIFDMDGTLLDTLIDLKNAVNHVLEQFGYPTRSTAEIRRFLGGGARNLIVRAMPEGSTEEKIDEVLDVYRVYYAEHANDLTAPYPGIVDMLETLKQQGVKLAVASNKPDEQVKSLTQEHFGRWIDHAMGDREGMRCKPHPDMVYEILKPLGVDVSRALYVGDSEFDVQTAINAGMDCAAVTWGFRDRDELKAAGAVCFADTAEELQKIVLG